MRAVTIFCDGSVLPPNPGGIGGWGFVVLEGIHYPDKVPLDTKHLYEGYGQIERSSNNISEMLAVHNGLEWCKANDVDRVLVVTDSKYVINGITEWVNNWVRYNWIASSTGELVKNAELWKPLYNLVRSITVDFKHVKGHQGNKFNEIADYLAGYAARAARDGEVKKWDRPHFCPDCGAKLKSSRAGMTCQCGGVPHVVAV